MVRAFAHGAMGRRIDPSWVGPIQLFSYVEKKKMHCLANRNPWNEERDVALW